MTAAPETVVSLHGPTDVLQAVPYLLGFIPERSMVVIALSGNRVKFTGRQDLGFSTEPIWEACEGNHIDTAILVAYADTVGEAKSALVAAGELCQLGRSQTLWVVAGRWGLLHDDVGQPLPGEPSVATTALVAAGNGVIATRVEMAASFAPISDESALQFIWDATPELAALSLEQLAAHDVTWDTAVTVARAVATIDGRDAVWLALDAQGVQRQVLHLLGDRLRECARRVPAGRRAPVLFLCGWAYWRSGNGAWANVAVETTLGLDPDYSAALMLHAALAGGLDPFQTQHLDVKDLQE